MRMRSPSSAPPVSGLVGSTARMPTVHFCARNLFAISLTSVLFPAPGGPVTPVRHARPTRAYRRPRASAKRGSEFSAHEITRATAFLSPARKRSVRSDVAATRALLESASKQDLEHQRDDDDHVEEQELAAQRRQP